MTKQKKRTYDEIRKQHLVEDNEKEEKLIKRLTKKLKVNRHSKRKPTKHPLWVRQYGLDYLLDFETVIPNKVDVSQDIAKKPIGVTKLKTKRNSVDPFGKKAIVPENSYEKHESLFIPTLNFCKVMHSDLQETDSSLQDPLRIASSNSITSLSKNVRLLLNRVSESQMMHVVNGLTDLFLNHPRAEVRSIFIEECCRLLECTSINLLSSEGWLHQELAVCITCVHLCLLSKFQHGQFIGYLIEYLINRLMKDDQTSSAVTCSFSVFIAYLFYFGAIAGPLVLDILDNFLSSEDPGRIKAAHFMCVAVGVALRKANLSMCQHLVQIAVDKLAKFKQNNSELSFDLEIIIQRLSEKRSNEECIKRSIHLRKLMKGWTKNSSITANMCLSVRLKDILNAKSAGRWWLVGSACSAPITESEAELDTMAIVDRNVSMNSIVLIPEVEAAANKLGLRTQSKQYLFNILVTTPGGPEATAAKLLSSCSTPLNTGTSKGGGVSDLTARERELVQIVLHCVMAEVPFSRFYPRVLGGFLNHHRRFSMMIKCAFWDILKNLDLTVTAKSNAGRALGLLALVYEFPLSLLKNFNFGDESDGNVAFLRHAIVELCAGDYQKVLHSFLQLSVYSRLSRNCRIFMRKHFQTEEDLNIRATVLKLVSDMREAETF